MQKNSFGGKEMNLLLQRLKLVGLGEIAVIILLGYFLIGFGRGCWNDYWLLKDAREGSALITGDAWGGHNVVKYEYEVDQHKYAGKSRRNWKIEKYKNVDVGDKSIVYFSVSHPWLSALTMPEGIGAGLPVAFVALLLEIVLLRRAFTKPLEELQFQRDKQEIQRTLPAEPGLDQPAPEINQGLVILLIIYAACGLVLSLVVHLLSYAGIRPGGSVMFAGLHIGIFPLWIPVIFISKKNTNRTANKDFWKVTLAGCPSWMRYMTQAFFIYAVVNFVIFIATAPRGRHNGGPPPASVWRGFSGHWMAFYSAGLAVLTTAYRRSNEGKKHP